MSDIDLSQVESCLIKVSDRLKYLQRPEQEKNLLEQYKDNHKVIGLFPRDFGMEPWDWPQGVGLYGMISQYKSSFNPDILEYCDQWFKKHLQKGLPTKNINTTCPLLTLVDLSDGNDEYKAVCENWAHWIMSELPRTDERGFQHTTTKDASKGTLNLNENQIWIDTLFMTVLFMAKWGMKTENELYIQESIHQFLIMIKYLYNKKYSLFYHAWSFNDKSNYGEVFWCRGNCWYTSSVMDFIEILGEKLPLAVKEILIDTYKAQVKALCDCQSESGLWHTVLDDEDRY